MAEANSIPKPVGNEVTPPSPSAESKPEEAENQTTEENEEGAEDKPQKKDEPKKKPVIHEMTKGGWIMALCWALIYDLMCWLLTGFVIGLVLMPLINGVAWIHYFLWFNMRKISGFKGKLATGGIIELIPVLNLLPAWTAVVIWIWVQNSGIIEKAMKVAPVAKKIMDSDTKVGKLLKGAVTKVAK